MYITFAAGYERGTCDEDYCGRDYDTRIDPQAGGGRCGRCYRARAGFFNPIAPTVTFWGCISADNLRYVKILQPKARS